MLDSRTLLVGGTIRLTVPTYVDDVATTPSGITVTAYKNGIATGDSITPTLDHYGTGLSLVSYTPSGLAAGDTVTLKISATVSGTTRVTVAEFAVVSTASAIAALVAAGTVAGVSGDVTGKVLGGGSGTISGVGARVVDYDGQNVAPAATALSSATWTNALASALATAATSVATLLGRILGTLAAGTHQPQSGDAYPPAVSAASSSSTAATQATLAVKLAKAQAVVDTGQTPWQEVLIEQGTGGLGVGTELRRLALKTTDGTGVTSTSQVIGQKVDAS